MVYKQQALLPIIFQVDEGIIHSIEEYLLRNKLTFTRILLVSGETKSYKVAAKINEHPAWDHYTIPVNNYIEVERLKKHCEKNRYDLIIAVGGGKVLDTVKRVSYLINTNHLSIPTIISNDGIISPISVIKNSDGKSESIPGMMPMGVMIDLDIIQESPLNFLQAAAGDLLSNISATNDWIIAASNSQDHINDIAYHLSKSAANSLVYLKPYDLRSKKFLRILIQGLVNSGIAMSLSGSSRPCSGSEHIISHAIDYLGWSDKSLHGFQVGSISLFSLFLQKSLKEEHSKFAERVYMDKEILCKVSEYDDDKLKNLFETCRSMRPGRVTVLDKFTNGELIQKYHEFLQTK